MGSPVRWQFRHFGPLAMVDVAWPDSLRARRSQSHGMVGEDAEEHVAPAGGPDSPVRPERSEGDPDTRPVANDAATRERAPPAFARVEDPRQRRRVLRREQPRRPGPSLACRCGWDEPERRPFVGVWPADEERRRGVVLERCAHAPAARARTVMLATRMIRRSPGLPSVSRQFRRTTRARAGSTSRRSPPQPSTARAKPQTIGAATARATTGVVFLPDDEHDAARPDSFRPCC